MSYDIPSTKEILALRALDRPIDQKWVDWAVSMLQGGTNTPHLAILAGEAPPFNQFEMVALVDKAFKELGFDWSDREPVVREYAIELLERMLHHEITTADALSVLSNLCIELGYPRFLMDFYRLHFAREDLQTATVQWYWPDATRENMESVIREYAAQWIQENSM